MTATHLIYPMFAMVVLTMVVLVTLFRSRVRAIQSGNVAASYFRLFQGATEPEISAKAARHFSNLFEAPVLFYVACLVSMIIGRGDSLTLGLAWAYVAARVIHALVHLGGNRLRKRILAYSFSWLVLLALWLNLVIGIAMAA